MRVRCLQIINPATLKVVLEHPSIRIGAVYTVLEITASPDGRPSLRLDFDDGVPGLWDSAMFVTVDSSIPSNWVARVSKNGLLEFAPEPWLETGYWERYFDRDPAAVASFEAEREVILGSK